MWLGKPVCARCAGTIIQGGIKRVIAEEPRDEKSKWYETGVIAIQMMEEAGIEFIPLN
jgi:dCMP deaminase